MAAAGQKTPRTIAIPEPPAAIDPRTKIDLLLVEGDTLAAIDLLQDYKSRWSDSLLDVLVLPDLTPVPKMVEKPVVKHEFGTRLELGMIPDDTAKTWLGITRVDWNRTASRSDFLYGWGSGLSVLGLHAPTVDYVGLEPSLEGLLRIGRIHASTQVWLRYGNFLGADAGLDAELLYLATPSVLTGTILNLSLESGQEASLVASTERRAGPFAWTASIFAGWIRMIPPPPHGFHAMEFDSVAVSRSSNGSSYVDDAWSGGIRYNYHDLADHVDQSSWDIESVNPDRLRLRTRLLAMLGKRTMQWGPPLNVDFHSSLGQERWLPDARSTWAPGTSFLRVRGTSRVEAYGGRGDSMLAVRAPPLIEAVYMSALLSPGIRCVWRLHGEAWEVEARAVWNIFLASDPGHPFAETREGPELRASCRRIW